MNFRTHLWKATSFLEWYRSALTIYDLHSPTVFPLVEALERGDIDDRDGKEILEFRKTLRKDSHLFKRVDRGAAADIDLARSNSFGIFAQKSQAPLYNYRRLYRLSQFINADNILELGTGSGLGHYILRKARPNSMITSVDADPFLTEMARHNIGRQHHKSSFICDSFDGFWEDEAAREVLWDLIVLDGDHRGVALLNNYHQIVQVADDTGKMPTLFIDDIRWSPAMLSAWRELAEKFQGIVLDYFSFGILMPSSERDRYYKAGIASTKLKPWRLGFWA